MSILRRIWPRKNGVEDHSRLNELSEPFASTLRVMYSATRHIGTDGVEHDASLIAKIGSSQGMAIHKICRETRAKRTLEIGFAYGFSTLYFLAAAADIQGSCHTAIDPYEFEWWHGVGLRKVKDVGMEDRFRFISEISFVAVPELFHSGECFDVIFIDGDHRFDGALTDFTLSAMICNEGGHILLDDMWMPSIQKVASFIRTNRLDFAEVRTGEGNMATFRKLAKDDRPWNHFQQFS